MDKVSLPFIVESTAGLYRALWDGLNDISMVDLISARDQNSLLSFRVKGVEPKQVVDEFKRHYIFTRTAGAIDPPVVRIAIGFWNRESDMEKIVEVVKGL